MSISGIQFFSDVKNNLKNNNNLKNKVILIFSGI